MTQSRASSRSFPKHSDIKQRFCNVELQGSVSVPRKLVGLARRDATLFARAALRTQVLSWPSLAQPGSPPRCGHSYYLTNTQLLSQSKSQPCCPCVQETVQLGFFQQTLIWNLCCLGPCICGWGRLADTYSAGLGQAPLAEHFYAKHINPSAHLHP